MKLIKISLTGFLLIGMIVGCSRSQKQVTGNPGTTLTVEQEGLRVLCYNIHHCNPPSKVGVIDVDAIAKVIIDSKADIVALQEVDVHTGRSGSGLHQAEELARKTGMQSYFAKAISYDGGEYGVAILSKFPMEATMKYDLPTAEGTKGEPRILATAVITLPGNKRIKFANTHLDAQKKDTNRLLQIAKINEILKDETLPMIIAGDFNATPESKVISLLDKEFMRSCKTGCGFTIPEVNPTKTIDYIAFKPGNAFTVTHHEVINESYASDHLPVIAVLKKK
ncbi:MAG: endonuclease/exonuclease/phosphatase family protein [Flavitalea sp.]